MSTEGLPTGAAAYAVVPPAGSAAPISDYVISPSDKLDITVFREPDLSLKDQTVDASGRLLMPLIGSIQVAGLTPTQLSAEIARRLNERFLVDPQVTVSVSEANSQLVTVEGEVKKPGLYPLRGQISLLDALAMSEGVTALAKLNQVVVFRDIDGVRNAAVFDLGAIRSGRSPDPMIQGKDRIVVGYSSLKGSIRDVLQASPFLAIFRPVF